MDCSTPGLPVNHQLLEFTQTHVHWVGDAFQPSHLLSSPSPRTFNLSQHQSLALSLLCNKEFMIWTTVSTQSCFCWLYRPSPSSAAKNIINLISILTFRWCPCLLWPVHSFGKTLLAFALLHVVLQAQICLLLISWLPTFEFLPPVKKRTSFFFFGFLF